MSNIALFEEKHVRRVWHEEKWYFSVVDVVEVLTDSPEPRDYWYRVKKRDKTAGSELSTLCRQLKMEAADGKKYLTDCANAEGLLRIIQSIPSWNMPSHIGWESTAAPETQRSGDRSSSPLMPRTDSMREVST